MFLNTQSTQTVSRLGLFTQYRWHLLGRNTLHPT